MIFQIISLSGKTGLLYAFGPRPPAFSDKFQLGGPLDVRMIKQNGLGPRDKSIYFQSQGFVNLLNIDLFALQMTRWVEIFTGLQG